MNTYKIQRLFLEEYIDPLSGKEKLFFTEPFPWWNEEKIEKFYGENYQNDFWQELRVSNWHEFDKSDGLNDYDFFIPIILEHVLNLYQQNGYNFISHSKSRSFNKEHYRNNELIKGEEIILVFIKDDE